MGLNKSNGHMYPFIDETFNTIIGECEHNCKYCYMKVHEQSQLRLNHKAFNTDLGAGKFIFVGSHTDVFADNVPEKWILDTFDTCERYRNKYMFHTKNPKRFYEIIKDRPFNDNYVLCGTIETNRYIPLIMNNAPTPKERAKYMNKCATELETANYVTIEPIMDFDLSEMVELVKSCKPKLVSIGADSKRHGLPEPSIPKTIKLIEEINKFSKVYLKKNLRRILNDAYCQSWAKNLHSKSKSPSKEPAALF
ncbi:DUF5131 family protein [Carboxylicivirga sp. RSCT41]|uniref:DUF5131 family protein n=1 Tax=Carboxylicivirga agarovorans TaxID=3417570 RepID=UPI003D34E52C